MTSSSTKRSMGIDTIVTKSFVMAKTKSMSNLKALESKNWSGFTPL